MNQSKSSIEESNNYEYISKATTRDKRIISRIWFIRWIVQMFGNFNWLTKGITEENKFSRSKTFYFYIFSDSLSSNEKIYSKDQSLKKNKTQRVNKFWSIEKW